MLRIPFLRFWSLLVFLGAGIVIADCSGPEPFKHRSGLGGQAGSPIVTGAAGDAGGSSAGAGAAGSTGAAGDGAIAGAAGTTGAAGTGAAGTGAAGTGTAGTGAAGTGAAGTGAAGTGAAGTGAAGTGAAGTGAAGTTGVAGQGGKGGTGGPDAGTDAPAGCNCMLSVQYQCKQDGPTVGVAVFSVKVKNTGTTPIPLNTVTVRYWYTIDGTGAQTGTCNSLGHPCTVAFQSATPAKPKADEYVVVSFGSGTLAPGADTGDVDITMSGTGNYTQANDYSFASTGANYIDRNEVTAYVSGKLMDGTPP